MKPMVAMKTFGGTHLLEKNNQSLFLKDNIQLLKFKKKKGKKYYPAMFVCVET